MLYVFFTHVREMFGDVVLKPVVHPLRWSNMATMPTLPETQESIKEEIRRQVSHRTETHRILLCTMYFQNLFKRVKPVNGSQFTPKIRRGKNKNMVVFIVVLLIYA